MPGALRADSKFPDESERPLGDQVEDDGLPEVHSVDPLDHAMRRVKIRAKTKPIGGHWVQGHQDWPTATD